MPADLVLSELGSQNNADSGFLLGSNSVLYVLTLEVLLLRDFVQCQVQGRRNLLIFAKIQLVVKIIAYK